MAAKKDEKPAAGAGKQTVKLPLDRIIALDGGLRMLNGYERVIGKGDKERVINTTYDFSEDVAWNIARNIGATSVFVKLYNDRRNLLVKKFATKGDNRVDKDKEGAFHEAHNDLLAIEEDINLAMIRKEDLNVGSPPANPIPPSVLSAIEVAIIFE